MESEAPEATVLGEATEANHLPMEPVETVAAAEVPTAAPPVPTAAEVPTAPAVEAPVEDEAPAPGVQHVATHVLAAAEETPPPPPEAAPAPAVQQDIPPASAAEQPDPIEPTEVDLVPSTAAVAEASRRGAPPRSRCCRRVSRVTSLPMQACGSAAPRARAAGEVPRSNRERGRGPWSKASEARTTSAVDMSAAVGPEPVGVKEPDGADSEENRQEVEMNPLGAQVIPAELGPVQADNVEWICSICTLINNHEATHCDACEAAAPVTHHPTVHPINSWRTSQEDLQSEPLHRNCSSDLSEREQTPQPNPKDCSGCGNQMIK